MIDKKSTHLIKLCLYLLLIWFFTPTAVSAALPNPLLQYDFEDSANSTPYDNIIRDNSGNNLHSVISQTDNHTKPFPGPGKNGLSLVFDGTSILNVGDHDLLDLNSYTTSAWIKYEHFPAEIRRQEIYEKADTYWMNIRSDTSKLRAGGIFGACHGQWVYVDSQTAVPENTWTHVAATFDGSTLRVYINGQLENQAAAPAPVCDNNQPLIIGAKHILKSLDGEDLILNGPEAFFNGSIDGFRIYASALSTTQIQELMTSTAGLDLEATITSPLPNSVVPAAVTLSGTGSAPDGVENVLVGIRDQITNLWWNNGSWGAWALYPATVIPDNQAGTIVNWTSIFDPTGTTGSGDYRIFVRTRDYNAALSDPATLNFSVSDDSDPVTLSTSINSPLSGATVTAPVTISGSGSAPDGVDTVLLGIRDQISNLWWNNGSWGPWLLYPTVITPLNQPGTLVNWESSFNPTGTGGSGQYRIFARTRDSNGALADSVSVNFEGP